MKPAQVLDYQRALRDALRGSHYRNYLDGFLESMGIKGGIDPNRVDAHAGDSFADNQIRVLESAYAFHVDAEMTPLIRFAATSLDEEVLWQKEVFPTSRGFLIFDDPVASREIRQRNMRDTAIVWHWAGNKQGQAGVWVTMYSRWDDPQDEVSVELREQYGDTQVRRLGPLHISHTQFIPWGKSLGPATRIMDADEVAAYAASGDPIGADTPVGNPFRTLYATLALMGQTVTDVKDETLSPALKRHLGKKRIPPRVVIITLRRTEGSRQPGETMVDWAYRWITRGHWRKQPCGVGRGEIRVIWIADFVKGPADKPLHISDKVYDLRR